MDVYMDDEYMKYQYHKLPTSDQLLENWGAEYAHMLQYSPFAALPLAPSKDFWWWWSRFMMHYMKWHTDEFTYDELYMLFTQTSDAWIKKYNLNIILYDYIFDGLFRQYCRYYNQDDEQEIVTDSDEYESDEYEEHDHPVSEEEDEVVYEDEPTCDKKSKHDKNNVDK